MKWPAALLCLCLVTPVRAAEPDIRIDTLQSARLGFPGLKIRVRAAIRLDEHNRHMCFVWASERASGSGCQDVDGLAGPVSFWRDIRFVRGGVYEVTAWVSRDDNQVRLSNRIVIHIIEPGQEE